MSLNQITLLNKIMKNSVGYYIRVNRELQGLTLRELSEKCGVSHVQISKYERDIDEISEQNLNKITKALNCEYHDDKETEKKVEDLFFKLRNDIFYDNLDTNDMTNALSLIEDSALSTGYAHVYLLIKYVISVICDDENIYKYESILEHLNMTDSLEKQVYLQYKSSRLEDEKKYLDSLEVLMEAVPMHYDEKQFAMLNYHLSMRYSALNETYNALNALMKAKDVFRKYNNFVREMHCDLMLGNLHFKSNHYKEAFEYYSSVENEIKMLNIKDNLLYSVKKNKVLSCIFLKCYDQALAILDTMDKNNIFIIEAYSACYAMQRNYNQACNWANKGLEIADKDSIEYILFKIYIIIASENTDKKTLLELIHLYGKIESRIQYATKVILLDWIIEIAEKREEYKIAYEYLKLRGKYA